MPFFGKAAADGGAAAWQTEVDRFARQLEPRIRDAFLKAVAQITDRADLDAIEAAISVGNVNQVLALVGLAPDGAALGAVGTAAIAAAIQGAQIAADAMILPRLAPMLGVHFGFDALNPETVQHFRDYSLGLIREIGDQTRAGIRQALDAGYKAGQNPRATARDIRDMIGLTARQEQAVQNFRMMLQNGDREALSRQLRDRRFDPSVKAAIGGTKPLGAEKIDAMTKRYRERYLKYRAETIARTESIRALNVGGHEVWRQAAASGKVDASLIRRSWLVAHDERTCPVCAAIPGMNPHGVGLNEPFKTPIGPIMMPSVHPACRCSVFHRILEPGMTWRAAA